MDDASGQLGNNGTEIGYLVPRKNGVRYAIRKMAELPSRSGNSAIDTICLPFLESRSFLLPTFIPQHNGVSTFEKIRSYGVNSRRPCRLHGGPHPFVDIRSLKPECFPLGRLVLSDEWCIHLA